MLSSQVGTSVLDVQTVKDNITNDWPFKISTNNIKRIREKLTDTENDVALLKQMVRMIESPNSELLQKFVNFQFSFQMEVNVPYNQSIGEAPWLRKSYNALANFTNKLIFKWLPPTASYTLLFHSPKRPKPRWILFRAITPI